MTPTNEAGHGLPELPEPTMRELNPYHGSRIDPYAGATNLQWYTADQMRQYAIDYAAALALSRGVPADMVLVPVDPTDEMVDAGRVAVMALDCCGPKWTVRKHYEASGADPAGIPDDLLDAICPMPKADRAELVYRAMLAAVPAAAGAQGEAIAWTRDAETWGNALNEAAWTFVDECPEKSALLFNNTKGPLRAAILKYAELVGAATPQPAAADVGVRERAREILAKWYRAAGRYEDAGRLCMSGTAVDTEENIALLAVEDALSSHRQAGDVAGLWPSIPSIQRWKMERGSDGHRWSVYMDHCELGEWCKWEEVQQAWFCQALALVEKGAG